jgi:phosphoribosyl 1,2-cyclic phosphodiesterase
LYYSISVDTQTQVRVSALASGSSGNAFLVEAAGTNLLFDAGLNAGALEYYLGRRGVSPRQLAAIFVSHEHIDHVRGAGALARRYRLPVVASGGTFRAAAWQLGTLPEKAVQPPGGEVAVGGVIVRTFAVSHDAEEPCGFWIEAAGLHIAICTDLGCETDTIREPLEAADLLVLEANHDTERLWRGPYPYPLKRRVAGRHGHLSNADASRLVSELARDGRKRTVWLAHLSATNNTPTLALDAVSEPLSLEGCAHIELAILERDRPSYIWDGSGSTSTPIQQEAKAPTMQFRPFRERPYAMRSAFDPVTRAGLSTRQPTGLGPAPADHPPDV